MCMFRESWQQLLVVLDNREQRLSAAGEIHRFHRDVAEALSRIHDKDAAIPDDLGRDLNSVLALIRRHEGFENDLVALEAQLQVLFRILELHRTNHYLPLVFFYTVKWCIWVFCFFLIFKTNKI